VSDTHAGYMILTWHGLVDDLIFPEGILQLRPTGGGSRGEGKGNMVREERAEGSAAAAVSSFYRVFEAQVVLDAFTAWVEQGREPDALPATITMDNVTARKNLCRCL
jgi:hypothetical protein